MAITSSHFYFRNAVAHRSCKACKINHLAMAFSRVISSCYWLHYDRFTSHQSVAYYKIFTEDHRMIEEGFSKEKKNSFNKFFNEAHSILFVSHHNSILQHTTLGYNRFFLLSQFNEKLKKKNNKETIQQKKKNKSNYEIIMKN